MLTFPVPEQHRRHQLNLIEFLKEDLDLAFVLLKMQTTEAENATDRNLVVANIRRVLDTVQHFEGRIEDHTASREIHIRAIELKSDLEAF